MLRSTAGGSVRFPASLPFLALLKAVEDAVDALRVAVKVAHFGVQERARRRLTAGLSLTLLIATVGILFAPREWWAFALLPLVILLALTPRLRSSRIANRSVGEADRVARMLKGLEADGFELVSNVETPLDVIEHVLIGPTGVFVIDTRAWRGRVHLSRSGHLTHNGLSAREDLRKATRSAIEIRRILARSTFRGWVFPILVLTQARLSHPVRIDTTTICQAQDLSGIVRSRQQQHLDADEVTRATSCILRATAPISVSAR
jgi:hypothetical protein